MQRQGWLFCFFALVVQFLTNKWTVTKNRAHSEGEAHMGLQTSAAHLMNTTKTEWKAFFLFFFFSVFTVYVCTSPCSWQNNHSTAAQLCKYPGFVSSVVSSGFFFCSYDTNIRSCWRALQPQTEAYWAQICFITCTLAFESCLIHLITVS